MSKSVVHLPGAPIDVCVAVLRAKPGDVDGHRFKRSGRSLQKVGPHALGQAVSQWSFVRGRGRREEAGGRREAGGGRQAGGRREEAGGRREEVAPIRIHAALEEKSTIDLLLGSFCLYHTAVSVQQSSVMSTQTFWTYWFTC